MTKIITPTGWFYNMFVHSQNKSDSNLPSRLEIAFLLDSGASILVPDIPVSMVITQMFNVSNYDQNDTSETLTIASQSEISNKLSRQLVSHQ